MVSGFPLTICVSCFLSFQSGRFPEFVPNFALVFVILLYYLPSVSSYKRNLRSSPAFSLNEVEQSLLALISVSAATERSEAMIPVWKRCGLID